MLAAKMDLFLKRLDERAADKEVMKGTVKAMDSQMTSEVCGEADTRGTTALKLMKKHHTSTMGSDKVITTGGTINLVRKEVTQISIPIAIRINLP